MVRQALKNDVPDEWHRRRKAGLCPVCGKTPDQFDKGRRVFCSVKCTDKYSEKYEYWSEVRERVLDRDDHVCVKCKDSSDRQRDEYDKEEKRRLKAWAESNNKLLQTKRDERMVWLDKRFKEDYDELMDDIKLAERVIGWEEKQKLMKGLSSGYGFTAHVDHIIPVAMGGDMWDEKNMQTLCERCHAKKTKEDIKNITAKKRFERIGCKKLEGFKDT